MEITAEEQKKEKRMKRIEHNLRDLWDNTKLKTISETSETTLNLPTFEL